MGCVCFYRAMLCFWVSSLIQKLNLFSLIGKHSFYIMCFHFVTFAFINVILSGFKDFDLGWEMEYSSYWFIYCMGGICAFSFKFTSEFFEKRG